MTHYTSESQIRVLIAEAQGLTRVQRYYPDGQDTTSDLTAAISYAKNKNNPTEKRLFAIRSAVDNAKMAGVQ